MGTNENNPDAETSADIVRGFRNDEFARSMAAITHVGAMHDLLCAIADRIEEAEEREREEVESNALSVGGIVEATRRRSGDSAAMRDALERAIDAIQTMIALYDEEHTAAIQIGATWERSDTSVVNEIVEQAIAALAAPARNCDRYGDEDDAFAAWHDALNDGDVVSVRSAFAWLFAKAEGGAE